MVKSQYGQLAGVVSLSDDHLTLVFLIGNGLPPINKWPEKYGGFCLFPGNAMAVGFVPGLEGLRRRGIGNLTD